MMSLPKHSCWYAVQVRPRWEVLVSEALSSKGYETFVPLYKVKKKWSDRRKTCELPLFLGYTFCRYDPEVKHSIVSTAGVMRIVGMGSRPLPIDDKEIVSLKIVSASDVECTPHPFFHAGQEVKVIDGILSGVRGIVLADGKKARIVISVQLVQASVVVEVDASCVVSSTSAL